MNDRKNKMTDTFSIGQFSADHSLYSSLTVDQNEKSKSPRFAFLKISATHCTHLQSRTSQLTAQALQNSAISQTLNTKKI